MNMRWRSWLWLSVTAMFMLLLSIPVLKAQTPEGEPANQSDSYTVLYNSEGKTLLPIEAKRAVEEAAQAWKGPPPENNIFSLSYLRWEKTWALGTLITIDLNPTAEQEDAHLSPDDMLAFVLVETEQGWQAAIEGDEKAQTLLSHIPDLALNPKAKSALFPSEIRQPGNILAQQYNNYKFPWPKGEAWRQFGTLYPDKGWHVSLNSTKNSLDFDIVEAGKTNSDILAAAPGEITHICGGIGKPDWSSLNYNEQYYVVVKTDGTTEEFVYVHIDGATFRSLGLGVGTHIEQGQKLGRMRAADGGEVIGACAFSYGTHIHLEFPAKPFTIDGVVFSDENTHQGQNLYSTQGADSEPPDTTITSGTSGWTRGGASFEWTGTDDVTDVEDLKYRYRLKGLGNWSGWTSATNKNYSAKKIPHGWRKFQVQARDKAGNKDPTPATRRFGVDLKRPSTPNITLSGVGCGLGLNGRWQNSCRDIAFGWSATDKGSGVQGYSYYWGNASNGKPTEFRTENSYDPGPITDVDGFAKSYLHVKTHDNVDRVSGKATFALWYDGTTPDVSFEINNGANTTSLTTVLLNLNASDTGSGVEAVRMSNNSIDWSDWLPYAETLSWNIPTLNKHTYTVYVQVHDKAGNLSNVATDAIYLDLTPPMPHSENFRICQDVLNNGGSAALGSSSFRLSSSIGEPVATGANASTSASFIHEGGFLANTVGCLPIVDVTVGYNMTHSVIASGGSLRSSSSFQIGDTIGQPVASGATAFSSSSFNLESGFWAGDSSSSTASSLEVGPVGNATGQQALVMPQSDLSAPTINQSLVYTEQLFAVRINDGAEYTNNPFVTLQLEAPNATEMRISASEEMTDTAWQSYQMTMTWALSDSTDIVIPQAVYAEFKDAEENVYGPYLAEITYDPNPPEGYMSILGNDTSNVIELYLEAWDDNSGVTEVGIADNPEMSEAIWQPYTETVAWEMNEPYVYVQFKDQTGNISETYIDGYQEPPMSTMVISVTLQGRPSPPNSRLSVPLDMSLTIPGEITPTYVFTPTTDNSGVFTLTNIVSNTYEIRVKKSTTLQNMVPVTLITGTNTIDLGVLREGDANDDNFVTIIDFSILAATFGICEGTDGYDERADFNGDGCITIIDFSLLASNFGQSGHAQRAAMTPNRGSEVSPSEVAMSIEPAQTSIEPGDVFNITVRLDGGEQQVDGAQIQLNFDPDVLVVEEIRTEEQLELELANQFDNEAGTIQFAAGTLQGFPSGEIDVMDIQFKALKEGEVALTFSVDGAIGSDVTFGGASVLGELADGVVVVNEPTAVTLGELGKRSVPLPVSILAAIGLTMLAGALISRRRG